MGSTQQLPCRRLDAAKSNLTYHFHGHLQLMSHFLPVPSKFLALHLVLATLLCGRPLHHTDSALQATASFCRCRRLDDGEMHASS